MVSSQTKEVWLEQLMPIIRERLAAGKSVRFSPRGVSMLPMIRQGVDSVLLSPLPPKIKKYDLPLYQRDNGQYVLHRVVKVGQTYTCIGDNQFEFETDLRQDQMIAMVTMFTHGKKEIPVDRLSYRIYCRFWHYSRPVRYLLRKGIRWLRRHIR